MSGKSVIVGYKLFIDDERQPPDESWLVVRSSNEAIEFVKKYGMPSFISFDHDLGGTDTTMVFLKQFYNFFDLLGQGPPEYTVHSANPIGAENIKSFMESWKRSLK